MDPMRAHAWIFLTVTEEPIALTDMIGVADALNHELPSHEALQDSLGWLLANGFVAKEGQAYRYTEKGARLRSDANEGGGARASWSRVEKAFAQIAKPKQADAEITQEAYAEAVKAYEKWFRDTYRLLTGK